jgi:predicted dehydrogenase
MGQLRVAVIGCGLWGYHHARVYSELPHLALEAVADVNPERVQLVTGRFHCRGYGSAERMLEKSDVDAVSDHCLWGMYTMPCILQSSPMEMW